MNHIEQLKTIRSDAIERMRKSADFKLAGKLGVLIVELGETVEDSLDYDEGDGRPQAISRRSLATTVTAAETVRPFENTFSKPKANEFTDLASDKMIDELVAEIEGDVAELDSIAAEGNAEDAFDTIGPFLKPDHAQAKAANGSAH